MGQAYLQIILYRCRENFRFIEKDRVGSNDLIYTVMTYLLSHFQETLTLGSVAENLGVNKFALSKIFSGVFHTNFNQYLNEIRLNYASSLLENTDMRIYGIFHLEAGFESQRTLTVSSAEVWKNSRTNTENLSGEQENTDIIENLIIKTKKASVRSIYSNNNRPVSEICLKSNMNKMSPAYKYNNTWDCVNICKGAFLWKIFRFTGIFRHVPAVIYT